MRMSFNTMFNTERPTNPMSAIGKGSAKWLSILASILVGTGLLIIKFPVIFVTIISSLLFAVAFFVFMFALRCLRVAKKFENDGKPTSEQQNAANDQQGDRVFVEAKQR